MLRLGSPFAGIPTAVWNPPSPLIQTGDSCFGVRTNRFGFNITGTPNIPVVVEACADLDNPVWTSLQSFHHHEWFVYFSEPAELHISNPTHRVSVP